MQRNLIPLRTWRVVCLPDNYLAVLSTGGMGIQRARSDIESATRCSCVRDCQQYTICPTYRRSEETRSKFDWSRSWRSIQRTDLGALTESTGRQSKMSRNAQRSCLHVATAP